MFFKLTDLSLYSLKHVYLNCQKHTLFSIKLPNIERIEVTKALRNAIIDEEKRSKDMALH